MPVLGSSETSQLWNVPLMSYQNIRWNVLIKSLATACDKVTTCVSIHIFVLTFHHHHPSLCTSHSWAHTSQYERIWVLICHTPLNCFANLCGFSHVVVLHGKARGINVISHKNFEKLKGASGKNIFLKVKLKLHNHVKDLY